MPRVALAIVALLLGTGTGTAASPLPPPPPPYTLTLSAFSGPAGSDVSLQILAPAGRPLPARAETIVLTSERWIKAYVHAPLTLGGWTRTYADLPRGRALKAAVTIRTGNPTGHQLLLANTVVLFRPDLRFDSIGAPGSARIGAVVTFPVLLRETRGDAGAVTDVTLRGSGVDPVTLTNVRVEPNGTTEMHLTTRFHATGLQTVTLRTEGQVPGDYDPADNSAAFTVDVTPATFPTSYYGGYSRSQGIRTETGTSPGGGPYSFSNSGRSEMLYINGTSSARLTWPLDFTALALVDGVARITREFSSIPPADSYTDASGLTEYTWIVDPATSIAYRFLTITGPGQQTGFYYARSAADYVMMMTQNGSTTITPQLFGTFINGTRDASLFGSLRSSAGQIGGWTPLLPIVQTRRDEEATVEPPGSPPFSYTDHRDLWEAYGSGPLQP